MKIALSVLLFASVTFWCAVACGIGSLTVEKFGLPPLWGICALAMFILLALAGREINGQWFGVLIDTRNKMSLSRLQITLWTVMVLSAYLTMVMPRLKAMLGGGLNQEQALDITFPEQLIVAMGISAASFAGSNLINSNKKNKQFRFEAKLTPEATAARRDTAKQEFDAATKKLEEEVAKETARTTELHNAESVSSPVVAEIRRLRIMLKSALRDKEIAVADRTAKQTALAAAEAELAEVNAAQGLLHKSADLADANWSDLLRGEEISNFKLIEMSKVQMLFFTAVVVATYAAALLTMLRQPELLIKPESLDFPAFSHSLDALLGISHATYLSVKAIEKS